MTTEEPKEKLNDKQKKDLKEYKEYVEKKLTEVKYEATENTYSFLFENKTFEFRIPTVLEKTRIKAILASITRYPGAPMTVSSGWDIYSSGDLDLIYSTAVMTNTAVLMNSPKDFDIESFEKIYDLGELITLAERRFNDDKKKQSTDVQ